jgi:Bor protein
VLKILALLVLLPLTSSCLHTMTAAQTIPSPRPQERRQDFLLWGLVPLQSFSSSSCPNGISRVDTGMSFANFLFTAVTLGVYWGERIEVWCAEDGRTAQSLPPTPRRFYVVPTQ